MRKLRKFIYLLGIFDGVSMEIENFYVGEGKNDFIYFDEIVEGEIQPVEFLRTGQDVRQKLRETFPLLQKVVVHFERRGRVLPVFGLGGEFLLTLLPWFVVLAMEVRVEVSNVHEGEVEGWSSVGELGIEAVDKWFGVTCHAGPREVRAWDLLVEGIHLPAAMLGN